MLENCIMCDKEIDLDKNEHVPDESLFTYWCKECGEKETN